MKRIRLFLFLFIILLSACSSPDVIIPPEEKPIFVITYASNLETFRPQLQKCADENSFSFFIFKEIGLSLEPADLKIELGEPDPLPNFYAQVGTDKLVVILNKDNNHAPNKSELQNIFSGRTLNWETTTAENAINVWVLPMENNLSQVLLKDVLKGMPFGSNARIAPSPEEMLEAVSSDPNAIGFLPGSWVTPSVTPIDLQIEMPVLILGDNLPEGGLNYFVACLQSN